MAEDTDSGYTSIAKYKYVDILHKYKDRIVKGVLGAQKDIGMISYEFLKFVVISREKREMLCSLDPINLDKEMQVRYVLHQISQYIGSLATESECDGCFQRFLEVLQSHNIPLCRRIQIELGKSLLFESEVIDLTEKDIYALSELLASISHKWEELGISLNLPRAIIEDCRRAGNSKLRLCRIFEQWIKNEPADVVFPTLDNLKLKLGSQLVGEGRVALELEEKFFDFTAEPLSAVKLPSSESAPQIVCQSCDTEVADGMSTLLEVQVSPCNESVSYQWLKDGQSLPEVYSQYLSKNSVAPLNSFYSGINGPVLFIDCASKWSEGIYACRVRSGEEIIESTLISLKVCYPQTQKLLLGLYSKLDSIPKDSWPPQSSKSYIKLAIIKTGCSSDEFNYTIQGGIDDILAEKEDILYHVAFGRYDSGMHMLVEGRPGSGKTTLVHKVTQDWAKTGLVLRGAKFVFLVSLRLLVSSTGRKDKTLSDLLGLHYHDKQTLNKFVSTIQRSRGKGVCFILDGLDEYPQEEDTIVHKLLHKDYLSLAMIVVASRPVATAELRRESTRRLEVLGFTKEHIYEYVGCYPFNCCPENSTASKLNAYLKTHVNVLHMCYLPVYASIVCFLYDKLGDKMPHTETQICKYFCDLTILRKLKRGDKNAKLDSMNDSYMDNFSRICKLAFDMTLASKQALCQSDAEVPLSGSSGSDCPSLGMLTIDSTASIYDIEDLYSFHHLTFQEYLAACHIASQDKQLEVIKKHGGKPNMLNVWKFYSGISGSKMKVSHLEEIVRSVGPDTLHQIHCAFESQQTLFCDCVVESGENGALSFTDHIFTPSDLTAIGYVASNSSHPVKKLTFEECKLDENEVLVFVSKFKKKLKSITTFGFHKMAQFRALNILLKALPSLEVLDLQNTILSPENVEALTKGVQLQCLKCIKLHMPPEFNFTRKLIKMFELLKFESPNLERIDYFQEFTAPRYYYWQMPLVHVFGPLLHNFPSLVLLNASISMHPQLAPQHTIILLNCAINDIGAEMLAEGLMVSLSIERIELNFNQISGKGAKALAATLQSCNKVKIFSAHCNQIDDSGAEALATALVRSNRLKKVDLQGNAISKEGAVAITTIMKHCSQVQLHLFFLSSASMASIQALHRLQLSWKCLVRLGGCESHDNAFKCCNYLLTMNLSALAIDPETLTAGLRHCHNLKLLNLSSTLGCEKALKELKFCPALEVLCFNNNVVHEAGAGHIARGLSFCQNMHTLYLSNNRIGAAGAERIGNGLKLCGSLKSLFFSHNESGPEGAQSLSDGLKSCKCLKTLYLDDNNIGPLGAANLLHLLNSSPRLVTLNLSRNDIKSEGVQSLSDGLKYCSDLQSLDLSYNAIGPSGAKALGDAFKSNCHSLKCLNLEYNDIGPDGAMFLADGLLSCHSLETLNLMSNVIASTGTVAIAGALKSCSKLKTLNFPENCIGSAGVVALADALRESHSKVEMLSLYSNCIDSKGAVALAGVLRYCNELQVLYLDDNFIGFDGAMALTTGLEHCPEIKEIHLQKNNIDLDPKAALVAMALKLNIFLKI